MLIALQRSSENDDVRLSTDKESAAHVCKPAMHTNPSPKGVQYRHWRAMHFNYLFLSHQIVGAMVGIGYPVNQTVVRRP